MTDADIADAADIPDDALRAYYEDAADVWATMSTFDGSESLIVPGTSSDGARAWYYYDDEQPLPELPDDVDADDAVAGRPWSARADRDEIVDELLGWDYRLPHLTINYQQRGLDDWETKVFDDDGSSWVNDRPLPGYGDIDAVALFADVDFSAEEKQRPVDDATRDRVETILRHWRDAYAGVVDDRDAVAILDSVGGTYIMLRPAATAPITEFAAQALEPAERQQLMKEIQARWRAFNTDVDDAADDWDAFAQDGDTNKNRLYKAPLAIHKSLPGVVTPIDTDDPQFELTHWDDVDSALIDDVNDWGEWFTDRPDAADDWAAQILSTLFDDVDADSWRDDIRDWASEQEQTDTSAQTQTLEDIEIDAKQLADDIQFVSERGKVWDAIASLNCEDVASELGIISTSDTAKNDKVTRIEINWRQSDSGDSAYVGHSAFHDMDGMDMKGGAATLVAYTLIGSSNSEPTDWRKNPEHIETVLQWFISHYPSDVPVYIPQKGGTYTANGETKTFDQTPNWALRRVAELLDIAPDIAFDDETDACIVPSLYNRILAVLDAASVDHNREYRDVRVTPSGDDVQAVELDVDVDAVIEQSPSDIPADAPGDTSADSEQSGQAETWTERYGIAERDSVDEQTMSVRVPGVDLQWLELADGRAGWGWMFTYYDDDGQQQIGYEFVVNADIELLSRLDYPERREQQTEWRVRINPTVEGEPCREITLTPAAFNSSRELRDELIGQTESVVFNAQGKGAKAVNELKQLVHAQDAPRRKAHEKIELVTDDDRAVFVTPNGTIDANGWVDEPQHVFESVASGVKGDWRASPDAVAEPDNDIVAKVCELMPQIRDDREQWLSMMGYAFASSLRPVLFNQPASRVNTWNLMHVSGKSGAGKSAVAKTLSGAIGMNSKSTTGAEKTAHAQEHMFSATNGMTVAMDEYNPKNWANWKADAFHEHLKKSTDAQSIEKGNADQSLTEYRFEVSPLVLGEQQLPESMPALPRRAIEVTLQTLSTARGTDTAEKFNELRGLSDDDWGLGLHHHAVAFWSYVCDAAEQPIDIVNSWHQTNDWLREQLDERGIEIDAELPRAMHQQGLQTVAFGLRRWRQFALSAGADASILFDDSDIVDTLEHLIQEKTGEHAASVDNENALLELLGDAAAIRQPGDEYSHERQEYVEYDEHYTIVNYDSSEPTELRLHLKSVLTQLSKFSRDYGIDATLYQRSDYYRWFKSAAENPDSIVIDATQKTYLKDSQKRCVAIDFDQMTDVLDVHPDDLLTLDAVDDEFEQSADDDDGGGSDGVVSIDSLQADDYAITLTADVVSVDDDQPPAIRHKATLEDATGTIEAVVWDDDDSDHTLVEGDEVTIANANVGEFKGDLQLNVNAETTVDAESPTISDSDARQAASTDGGSVEYDGIKGQVRKHLRLNVDSGETVTAPAVAGKLADSDATPGTVTDALNELAASDGVLERLASGTYKLL